jgi:GT2 family glycosyltransferase
MIKVDIGMPASDECKFRFALSLASICAYRSNKYVLSNSPYGQGCYVHENRNHIVELFLERGSDWLLQIDTDIVFDIFLIENLLTLAEKTKSKIVAGWYMNIVKEKYVPLVYKEKDGFFKYILPSGSEPISVDVVGTGCLMTHREVFEKTKNETSSPWFYFEDLNNKVVGEDFVFCRNARKLGYTIFIDPKLRVKHLKLGEV